MNDSELIIFALEETLPIECDVAGSSNVEDIAESAINQNLEFKKVEGASYIDLDSTITLLTSAAGLAAQLIQLYRDWKETKKTDPELKDIKDNIDDEIKNKLDEELIKRICNTIINKLKINKGNDKK